MYVLIAAIAVFLCLAFGNYWQYSSNKTLKNSNEQLTADLNKERVINVKLRVQYDSINESLSNVEQKYKELLAQKKELTDKLDEALQNNTCANEHLPPHVIEWLRDYIDGIDRNAPYTDSIVNGMPHP